MAKENRMNRMILAAVLIGATVSAQGGPAFEVASVKPNVSNSGSSSSNDSPGGYTAINMSLRRLIAIAYRMQLAIDRDRIVGPSWIDTARFDIAARTPAGTPQSRRYQTCCGRCSSNASS